VSLDGHAQGDRPKRQADRAQLTSPRDRHLLSLGGNEPHAVSVQGEAVREAPARSPRARFAASAARVRARIVLILRRAVDHDLHEGVGGRVAVSLACGACQAGARAHGGTLDLHGEHYVPGDAIALGETTSRPARCLPSAARSAGRSAIGATLQTRRRCRRRDRRTRLPRARPLADRPRLDARALSFGRVALFIGGRAQVGDRDVGMADDVVLPHDPQT
jgi:hypothetical protein